MKPRTKKQKATDVRDIEALLKARVYCRAAYTELCDYYDNNFERTTQYQMNCLSLYYDLDKEIMDLLGARADLQSLTLRVAKIKLT